MVPRDKSKVTNTILKHNFINKRVNPFYWTTLVFKTNVSKAYRVYWNRSHEVLLVYHTGSVHNDESTNVAYYRLNGRQKEDVTNRWWAAYWSKCSYRCCPRKYLEVNAWREDRPLSKTLTVRHTSSTINITFNILHMLNLRYSWIFLNNLALPAPAWLTKKLMNKIFTY